MTASIALAIGIAAGIHTSTWGMYKDAPHEGFGWPRYFRSTIAAMVCALVIWRLFALPAGPAGFLVLFGATYAAERAITEFYKTFLRQQSQSKYTIPMQFAVFGRPVESRGLRLLAGLGHVVVALAVMGAVHWTDVATITMPWWLRAMLVGSLGGWISAFGGAWKDAPIEGFQTFKFFRSPGIALLWSLVLGALTDDLLLVAFGGLGYTIATIETWKTFFFPSVPRGKFADKPVLFPECLVFRKRFVPVYVAIWLTVLTALAGAVTREVSRG
ncbi:MAG: hypothetical protein OEW17_05760 [Gemmatimonadota bacterium]|nr:hypothetical protein [Gemmatimonadota bacterium]MDH4348291.1 hypothetical protein [Gemmatimonadota bacterium]MDH5282386.1 hypothetical protein [Gemmatimonadota bacterium]